MEKINRLLKQWHSSPDEIKVTHIKTGNTYYAVTLATNTTNAQDGQKMVLYRNPDYVVFVRELSEFAEKFDW